MEQWYTLYTKPNSEHRVETALRERGFQTYLPKIVSAQPSHGLAGEPLFPCYLLFRIDLKAVGFSQFQWVPGLRHIVTFDGQPAPVPEEVVDLIRCRLDGLANAGVLPDQTFKPGDAVRIVDGPFRDMLAIFDGPAPPAKRVQVFLHILGRASRVGLAVTNLEKVVAEPEAPASRPRGTRGRGRHINYKH